MATLSLQYSKAFIALIKELGRAPIPVETSKARACVGVAFDEELGGIEAALTFMYELGEALILREDGGKLESALPRSVRLPVIHKSKGETVLYWIDIPWK